MKKLGRIADAGHRVTACETFTNGAESSEPVRWAGSFVHLAVDDTTRLAFVEVLADEPVHAQGDFDLPGLGGERLQRLLRLRPGHVESCGDRLEGEPSGEYVEAFHEPRIGAKRGRGSVVGEA
jgi:hypothetical protein